MDGVILEARIQELEKQAAVINDLKSQVKDLKKLVTNLKDIEEIKILQKAYGYYLEHWMGEEVADCFSDSPDCCLKLLEGIWKGKDGVRRYFERWRDTDPEMLHQVLQISGIVNIDPDGKTARGRWYSWGACAIPSGGGVRQFFMNGIYENVYIKENGVWKLLILEYNMAYAAPPDKGWVSAERLAARDPNTPMTSRVKPDISTEKEMDTRYPSGYIFPFHFKHPVTGKETSEARRNSILKLKPRGQTLTRS
jgi:hypothetical protein